MNKTNTLKSMQIKIARMLMVQTVVDNASTQNLEGIDDSSNKV